MGLNKVKVDFDYKKLEEIGYNFVPIEGGYVSGDKATIVLSHRTGQKRKVLQYRKTTESEHKLNVDKLKEIGALEY